MTHRILFPPRMHTHSAIQYFLFLFILLDTHSTILMLTAADYTANRTYAALPIAACDFSLCTTMRHLVITEARLSIRQMCVL